MEARARQGQPEPAEGPTLPPCCGTWAALLGLRSPEPSDPRSGRDCESAPAHRPHQRVESFSRVPKLNPLRMGAPQPTATSPLMACTPGG